MAERESVYLWSTTALTNGAVDSSINFAEGQLPGTVNNSSRSVMAASARFLKDSNGSITSGGSANAYTLTINGTHTAYATGQIYSFIANFTNTSSATLTVTNGDSTSLGSKAIRVFLSSGESAVLPDMIKSGGHYLFQYDAAANSAAGAFILLNPSSGTVFARKSDGLTPHENLVNTWASNSTLTVTADGLVLFDASGNAKRYASVSVTVDITVSGANGLDTGAEAGTSYYHIWGIGKPDGTFAAVLSTNSNPTLPSGYTYYGMIGAVFNDGSSNFYKFKQLGNIVSILNNEVLTNGTSSVYSALSINPAVPPTARRARVFGGVNVSSGTSTPNMYIVSTISGGAAVYAEEYWQQEVANSTAKRFEVRLIDLTTARTLNYKVIGTSAQGTVQITGFEF
jgi:hypothetical protein